MKPKNFLLGWTALCILVSAYQLGYYFGAMRVVEEWDRAVEQIQTHPVWRGEEEEMKPSPLIL